MSLTALTLFSVFSPAALYTCLKLNAPHSISFPLHLQRPKEYTLNSQRLSNPHQFLFPPFSSPFFYTSADFLFLFTRFSFSCALSVFIIQCHSAPRAVVFPGFLWFLLNPDVMYLFDYVSSGDPHFPFHRQRASFAPPVPGV